MAQGIEGRQFDWVPFYQEFADKLLPYKNNRQQLIEIVKQIFASIGMKLPTLEKDNQLVDIDPFTPCIHLLSLIMGKRKSRSS